MLMTAKDQIKTIYKLASSYDPSQINNFYAKLKMSNQLFFFLTNKDQEAVFLKFQTQKIIYYLIKLLLRDKATYTPILSKDDSLTVL